MWVWYVVYPQGGHRCVILKCASTHGAYEDGRFPQDISHSCWMVPGTVSSDD